MAARRKLSAAETAEKRQASRPAAPAQRLATRPSSTGYTDPETGKKQRPSDWVHLFPPLFPLPKLSTRPSTYVSPYPSPNTISRRNLPAGGTSGNYPKSLTQSLHLLCSHIPTSLHVSPTCTRNTQCNTRRILLIAPTPTHLRSHPFPQGLAASHTARRPDPAGVSDARVECCGPHGGGRAPRPPGHAERRRLGSVRPGDDARPRHLHIPPMDRIQSRGRHQGPAPNAPGRARAPDEGRAKRRGGHRVPEVVRFFEEQGEGRVGGAVETGATWDVCMDRLLLHSPAQRGEADRGSLDPARGRRGNGPAVVHRLAAAVRAQRLRERRDDQIVPLRVPRVGEQAKPGCKLRQGGEFPQEDAGQARQDGGGDGRSQRRGRQRRRR